MPAAAIRKRGSDSQRGAASTRLLIREAVADGVGTDKLEHLPIGVFETDASGACRYVNARMCEFLGMSSVAALGYGWTSAVHPEDRDRVTSAWHDAVRDGQELAIEFRFQRPDGTVTWVAASVAGISGSVASGSGCRPMTISPRGSTKPSFTTLGPWGMASPPKRACSRSR